VCLRRSEQRPPHTKARHGIVGLCLREQPLRFRHFGDAGQAVLVTGPRLALARRGRLAFDGRVLRDFRGGLRERACDGILCRQILDRPFVPGALGQLILSLDPFPGVEVWQLAIVVRFPVRRRLKGE